VAFRFTPTIPLGASRQIRRQPRRESFATPAVRRFIQEQDRGQAEASLFTSIAGQALQTAFNFQGQAQQSEDDAFQIQRQDNERQEQEAQALQQQQLQELVSAFSPDITDLPATFQQAAAFRSGTTGEPLDIILEESRLAAGRTNLRRYLDSVKDLPDPEREGMQSLAAGMAKHGVSRDQIFNAKRAKESGDPSALYAIPWQDRLKINRAVGEPYLPEDNRQVTAAPKSELEEAFGIQAAPPAQVGLPPREVPPELRTPGEEIAQGFGQVQQPEIGGPFQADQVPPDIASRVGAEKVREFSEIVNTTEGAERVQALDQALRTEELTPREFLSILQVTEEGPRIAGFQFSGDLRNKYIRTLERLHEEGFVEAGQAVPPVGARLPETALRDIRRRGEELGLDVSGAVDTPFFLEQYFAVEQELIASHTRPVFRATLETLGVPHAEGVSELMAEVFVPSTLLPISKLRTGVGVIRIGSKTIPALEIGLRALGEGLINMEQYKAGRAERGQDPPSPEESVLMFVTGAVFGGAGPLALPPAVRLLGRAIPKPLRDVAGKITAEGNEVIRSLATRIFQGKTGATARTNRLADEAVAESAAQLELLGRGEPRVLTTQPLQRLDEGQLVPQAGDAGLAINVGGGLPAEAIEQEAQRLANGIKET